MGGVDMGYKTCKTCHIFLQCENANTLRQFDLRNLLSAESRVTKPYKSPFVSSLWGVCFLDFDRLNLMWTYGGRDCPIVAENETIFLLSERPNRTDRVIFDAIPLPFASLPVHRATKQKHDYTLHGWGM